MSNGGYIDSNTADGLRLSLADEFSDIYCYNLRGNQRTAGELSRKEGGKIFGSGSRSTVAILILVKTPTRTGTTTIHYRDVGDYLTREQKLDILDGDNLDSINWESITPNHHGDWINQRSGDFNQFTPIGDKGSKDRPAQAAIFATYSAGLKTNRDVWVYNYTRGALNNNVGRMISFYNQQASDFTDYCKQSGITKSAAAVDGFIDNDPTRISWNRGTKSDLVAGKRYAFHDDAPRTAAYRPFTKQWVYFDRQLNDMVIS